MARCVFIAVLLISTLYAKEFQRAQQSCEAFNNLKHTRNSGNVRLQTDQTYAVLREHKGHKLVRIEGADPVQRWVVADCLARSIKQTPEVQSQAHVSTQNLLALSWQNAFCEFHSRKAECKRGWFAVQKARSCFTLHGLWPQPRSNVYCGVKRRLVRLDKRGQWKRLPEPDLSKETFERLSEVMPAVVSYLHRHEWIKHGTCYGENAERYFQDSIALTETFRASKVSTLFRRNMGKRVTIKQVRAAFDKSFGKGSGKRVKMVCKKGLITELRLNLSGDPSRASMGELLKGAKPLKEGCKSGIVDMPGINR